MSQTTLYKIAVPYAEALLELAERSNALDKTAKDLAIISKTIAESNDLKVFLSNPLASINSKKQVISQLFADEINDFILNFLLVLVDRRRISLLNIIIEKYFDLAYKLESTILTEVSSFIQLTELQEDALRNKIKIMSNCENVKLITTVDSSLIGGFIIKIGSKVIDASLSGKLKQMAFYLDTN